MDHTLPSSFELRDAFLAFADVVGPDQVITEPAVLREAETATFATDQRVPLVVKPANRGQVQSIMRIADRCRIPIYPISSGKNWGYGSRVPPADGSVLLDLSRMNQIFDFNEELAYVTLAPGVTQQQLYDFLAAKRSRLWMDATGSSPECSIIGNAMERGFGHTPYSDHFSHVCGLEIVLPNGDCIETGFARLPATTAAPLYRWGVGPSLDGLFSQSNFGIVTRMTVWLMPAPEYFQAFFFRCDDAAQLPAVVDALRPLRLNGTLRSALHVGNDYKVLNGIRQYPWEETGGTTPLRPSSMQHFRQQFQIGAWNGGGGLYGTRAQVKESERLLRRALRGKVSKLRFLDDRKLDLAKQFSGTYRLLTGWDLSAAIELVRPVYGLLKGMPSWKPLAGAYWRKRMTPPADANPDRDRCGLLWCAPVAPLQGSHAQRLSQLSSELLLAHGFEPMLSMTLVTERALTCVISIIYDREVPGEDERAMRCYRELLSRLISAGYPSYRLGIQSMQEMDTGDSYAELFQRLKSAIDPNAILAPGRYQPAWRYRQPQPSFQEKQYVAGD
jgi:4-cresol dehydrogenase (hydroxylating)